MPFRQQVASREEFQQTIEALERQLAPGVTRIRWNVGEDNDRKECLFFRVVLSDEFKAESLAIAKEARSSIYDAVRIANIDMFPYVNFRLESEVKQLGESDWF